MNNNSLYEHNSIYMYDYAANSNWTSFILEIGKAHEVHSQPIAVYAIILTCLSTIVNSVLCYVTLVTRELRRQPLYACVFNFCFMNLLMGLFVTSLVVYHEMSPTWKLGLFVCRAWVILDVFLPFTSFMTLMLMSIDRFFYARFHSFYQSAKFRFQREIYLLIPWIIGMVVVIPLWVGGFQQSPIEMTNMCVFGLVDEASVASPILVFFLPAFFLILVMIITHFFSFRKITRASARSISSRSAGTPRDQYGYYAYENNFSAVTLYLINVTFLIMWSPYHMMSLLLAMCLHCMPPYSLIVGFTYMGTTASSIISFLWLTDYHVRFSLKHVVCDRFKKVKHTPSNNVSLTLLEA